ncbi:MAG: UDP-N-acetylmuramate--L-alanine ligase [Clostridia bacterium]|nr:UDP-N-acetylmuramate--L-alanine ligase [Clostridia bacterium]
MLLKDFNKIHFIGIGGISMSSLAEILLHKGKTISGSDGVQTAVTDSLEEKGIKVAIGQRAENITDDIELVVYTAAVSEENPELKAARASKACVIDRAELVGMLMLEYKHPISVAGTHGKTTTSSLVTEILLSAQAEPTVSIGGMLPSIGGNYKVGSDDYFVLETCEYCDSFLKFNPHSAIILNVDKDHIDYFKNLDNIYKSFNKFAKRIPSDGFLIINNEIPRLGEVTEGIVCPYETYGSDSSADWYPMDISYDSMGHGAYTVNYKGNEIARVNLSIPGGHNVYNSLSAFALCYKYGISVDAIVKGINNYHGTDRRFQYKGSFKGVKVIDDYAHHPTEIAATINSARANDINSLCIVFQPHTYSRTYELLDEFAQVLSKADKVVLVDIYASREKDTGLVSSRDLAGKIVEHGGNAEYCGTFENAETYVLNNCNPQDMLITMGAGDIVKLGEKLVSME